MILKNFSINLEALNKIIKIEQEIYKHKRKSYINYYFKIVPLAFRFAK